MKSKTRKAAGKASLDPLVRCRAWGPECDRFKGTDGCWHGKDHKRTAMCDTHCSFRDSKTICAPNARLDRSETAGGKDRHEG